MAFGEAILAQINYKKTENFGQNMTIREAKKIRFQFLILSILPVLIVAFGEALLAQINYKKDGEFSAEDGEQRDGF